MTAAAARGNVRRSGRLLGWTLGLSSLLLCTYATLYLAWPRLSRTTCPRWPTDILAIESALEEYAERHGAWPEDLDALTQPDEHGRRLLELVRLPRDPWGREYRYDRPAHIDSRPRVYSLGADGKVGGRGKDSDLDN